MGTNHFTPDCAYCNETITTDDLCINENHDQFHHRDCYHDANTIDCEYCNNDINLNTDTVLPTKHGHYHRECFYKEQSNVHCEHCTEPLVTGQNQHKTTNDNGDTIYLCTECYDHETTEQAKDVAENLETHLEDQLKGASDPNREEQEKLGLVETPDGWKQEHNDE